ncbi:hypothetical protein IWW36_004673 [Coemansia brasiliensis]|uniref:Uncharacterized protein n=1 Tax=Coemansia brasiliensis TaxID=2650707 RepID=A0A9W8I7U9_9FUNG|nr:hypothetical protein IWW36_004673 [Coemansia brasiliensis]
MVDAHPQYNPSTYANNIAVLHWGDPYDITWHQYIAQDKPDWDNVFYTRRTMSSVSKKTWNTPATLSLSGTAAPSGCSSASNLYKSNENWFLCMAQTTTSIVNSKCQTPFGAAWAVYQPNNMAVAALYSHSAIYGGSELCGSTGNQYHYYTLLQPYADWAAKMTGRKVYSYAADSSYSYDGSSSFKMSNDLAPDVFGVKTVSGDVYPYAKDYSGPGGTASNNGETAGSNNPPPATTPKPSPTPAPTPKPDPQPTTANKPKPTTTNNNDNNNDNDNDNDDDKDNDNNNDNDDDNKTTEEQKSTDGNKSSESSGSSRDSSSSSSKSSSDSEDNDSSEESSDESSDDNSDDLDEDDNNVVGGNSNNNGSKDKDGSKKENNNGSDGDSSNGDSAAASNNESHSGLSRGATIAVATVVPIITIIIIVVLFFVYRWWRRRQNALSWDPKNESASIDRRGIMDEFEGVGVESNQRNSTPPSYDDHGFQGNLEADTKPPV